MRVFALTLGLALVPAHAFAQIGNPAGMAPDTRMEEPGVMAPNQTNYQDRLFALLAMAGGVAEVELGKLAAEKTDDDRIKHFAGRMMDDHGDANDLLRSIAEKSNTPLPDDMDADHRKMRSDLQKLDGTEFDLAYLAAQIVDHQKAAQLLAWEIDQGQDAELQRFAGHTLPTVFEHLEAARQLQAEITSEAAAAPVGAPSEDQ